MVLQSEGAPRCDFAACKPLIAKGNSPLTGARRNRSCAAWERGRPAAAPVESGRGRPRSQESPSLQCVAVTPIDDFLRREIALGSFPSAVYAIGSSRGIEHENALGNAVAVPLRIPATL